MLAGEEDEHTSEWMGLYTHTHIHTHTHTLSMPLSMSMYSIIVLVTLCSCSMVHVYSICCVDYMCLTDMYTFRLCR